MQNSNIERFWNRFEENQALSPNELMNILNEQIKSYSKGLVVEVNISEERKVLTVSPQGVKVYFSAAHELLSSAPTLEGWEIKAGKEALDEVLPYRTDGLEIKPEEVTFMPLESVDFPDDIAIRLYHKAYVAEEGAEQNAVIQGLYALLDAQLGEEAAAFDFQYIDFDDMPHPKEKYFPFSSLASFVASKKAKRAIHGKRFPKEEIGLLEGKVETLPTLLAVNNGLKYYEFTKGFPYFFRVSLNLKNIGDNGLPTGNTDELYGLEDSIYKSIYKEERGHFIATETFKGKREIFYYVDTLESIENSLGLLPSAFETCTFSYEVNYDPFWVLTESYIYM